MHRHTKRNARDQLHKLGIPYRFTFHRSLLHRYSPYLSAFFILAGVCAFQSCALESLIIVNATRIRLGLSTGLFSS